MTAVNAPSTRYVSTCSKARRQRAERSNGDQDVTVAQEDRLAARREAERPDRGPPAPAARGRCRAQTERSRGPEIPPARSRIARPARRRRGRWRAKPAPPAPRPDAPRRGGAHAPCSRQRTALGPTAPVDQAPPATSPSRRLPHGRRGAADLGLEAGKKQRQAASVDLRPVATARLPEPTGRLDGAGPSHLRDRPRRQVGATAYLPQVVRPAQRRPITWSRLAPAAASLPSRPPWPPSRLP